MLNVFFSRPAPPHSNFRIHCGLKHPDMTKPTLKSNHPATHGFGWGFSFEHGKFRIQCHFPRGIALRQSYPAAGMRMLTLHIWHPVILLALILIVTGLIAMGWFSKIPLRMGSIRFLDHCSQRLGRFNFPIVNGLFSPVIAGVPRKFSLHLILRCFLLDLSHHWWNHNSLWGASHFQNCSHHHHHHHHHHDSSHIFLLALPFATIIWPIFLHAAVSRRPHGVTFCWGRLAEMAGASRCRTRRRATANLGWHGRTNQGDHGACPNGDRIGIKHL